MDVITLLVIFIVIIGLILIGIANGNKNIGQIFLKIILIIIITIIGGVITCGGNLMLDSVFPSGGGYGSRYANELLIFWAVEIGAIFIFSVWFLFFKTKTFKEVWEKIKGLFIYR